MADSSLHFDLEPVDNERLANLCGIHDGNIKTLSRLLNVRIQHRGEHFRVSGSNGNRERARSLIRSLYDRAATEIRPAELERAIGDAPEERAGERIAGVKVRGEAQARYADTILANDITFGVGASGTGKTFIAMACAIRALEREEVRRIVLVRPAVEAGESLGYLPGDPVQKVNPYLRPLQDALHDITSRKQLSGPMRERIELAPLAFMRGRTLTSSFVILDEAQNTTRAQMLMFLTRLGQGSRCVVTGDESQIDLPREQQSGLADALRRTETIEGCAVFRFRRQDTMRHPVVERILASYGDD